MKVRDTPRTNKLANAVAYVGATGQCFRTYCIPRNPNTPAQRHIRDIFRFVSQGWGIKLTDAQRQKWIQAALTVPSHPSLDQYGHLSGQQFCVKINTTLGCVGQSAVVDPPDPVVFSPNPVGDLTIDYDQNGSVRLLVAVGTAVEDIMLFGQAPCSAGRMKQRRLNYLGLIGEVIDGQCDITALYTARYGQPAPGQKVFLITNQHKNGWKGPDHITSAIVPPYPGQTQQTVQTTPSAAAAKPSSSSAAIQGASPLLQAVYKGSTPDAQGLHKGLKREQAVSIPCAPLVHSVLGWWEKLFSPVGMGYLGEGGR